MTSDFYNTVKTWQDGGIVEGVHTVVPRVPERGAHCCPQFTSVPQRQIKRRSRRRNGAKKHKTTDLDPLASSEAKPRTIVSALVVEHVLRRIFLALHQHHETQITHSRQTTKSLHEFLDLLHVQFPYL